MRPRQVHDQVWLVGSGTDPDVLTDPHDCHTYLVWDGANGFLVDCGTGLGFERWVESFTQICDPRRLGGCLVTHYHADHAGGSARVSGLGVPVLGSAPTADSLRTGDEVRTQVGPAREAGIYPRDYTLASATLQPVAEGQTLRSGGISVDVIDTPGHCDGHVVFLVESGGARVMFSGDCLFSGGRVSMQAIHDCRLDAYAESVTRLAEREIDVMLPGHGDLVLNGAGDQVRRAAASFARLVPPPNFLSS